MDHIITSSDGNKLPFLTDKFHTLDIVLNGKRTIEGIGDSKTFIIIEQRGDTRRDSWWILGVLNLVCYSLFD